MLIKSKDSLTESLHELETIRQMQNLPDKTRTSIDAEIKMMKAGERGEKDAAYYIDLYYRDHENWAIIHDLRIEYGNDVAQIDHLLLNRLSEIYILETKSFAYGIKITERGEFLRWNGRQYDAMPSPIEQLKRHVVVLEKLLKGEELFPKRLGISMRPSFKPYVLVSPTSKIIRPSSKQFNTDMVIKSDELFQQIQTDTDRAGIVEMMSGAAKVISRETLIELSHRLTSYHKSIAIDYRAKFGVVKAPDGSGKEKNALPDKLICSKCGKPITERVADFCLTNPKRFGGKLYCFNCQKEV